MNKKQLNTNIASILALSLLFSSCSHSYDTEKETQTINWQKSIKQYSAADIFKSIYFLEGDFTNELNSVIEIKKNLPKLNEEEKEEFNKFTDEIIEIISKKDPKFFEELIKEFSSDNLFTVEKAYIKGAEKIREAGLESIRYGKTFLLADQFREKKVDVSRPDIQALDFSKTEDVIQFSKILENDYGISIGNGDKNAIITTFATCNLGIWCAVTLVVAATSVVAVQSGVGVWVYAVVTKTKFWDPLETMVTLDKVFLLDLNTTLRLEHIQLKF